METTANQNLNIKNILNIINKDFIGFEIEFINNNNLENIDFVDFVGFSALNTAQKQHLAFLTNQHYLKDLSKTAAGCIIINTIDLLEAQKIAPHLNYIVEKRNQAYALFAKLQQYFTFELHEQKHWISENFIIKNKIHASAIIHPTAKIAQNVQIGAFSIINQNAEIGENSIIGSHCNIEANSHVGTDCIIYPNVQIYQNTRIGNRVIIHSGSVIGSDGFGFAPQFNREVQHWLKIPQIGCVVIGDDVEIGANSSIDRAAFEQTKIGKGTKIDNLVQIAHNVEIGQFCVIAGCTAIAGSTKIGNFCMIGGSSQLAGHLIIADKTTISGGTSIMHSITETGQHYTGVYPALPHALWKRLAAYLRRLIKKPKN